MVELLDLKQITKNGNRRVPNGFKKIFINQINIEEFLMMKKLKKLIKLLGSAGKNIMKLQQKKNTKITHGEMKTLIKLCLGLD